MSAPGSDAADRVRALLSRGRDLYRNGDHDGSAQAYREALALQPDQAEAWLNLGAALMGINQRREAIDCYRRALALKPAMVAALLNLSTALLDEDAGEALRLADLALQRVPEDRSAWLLRGSARLRLGDHAGAEADARRVLAVDPQNAAAAFHLGLALAGQDRASEAVEAYRASLRIAPRQTEVWNRLIGALRELNRHREAEEAYETVHRLIIEENPASAEAHRFRGMALLALGRLKEGYAEYEWRWQTKEFAARQRRIVAPFWRGEPIAGRRLLLQWEQGLGDSIQYLRFAPALAAQGAALVAELQAPLVRLAQSMPVFERVVAAGADLPPVEFQLSLISLPHRLGTTLETIPARTPYLFAPETDRARWHARLAGLPRPLIGLVWRGSPTFVNDARRSMRLAALQPILMRSAGASWIALQKDAAPTEFLDAPPGIRLLDPAGDLGAPPERFADFADTAGLIAALDLVISVDTAVAHLAGALGKPVWLMLPRGSDARWLVERSDSPWYPTARLFRQTRSDDWRDLVEEVAGAVESFGAGPAAAIERQRDPAMFVGARPA